MKTLMTTLFSVLIIALLATACSSSPQTSQGEAVSVLTQQEAASLIDSALQALNTGDYSTWSQDWDDSMKAAIGESAFEDFRKQVSSQYGRYISLESVEMQPGRTKGIVRWVAIADFERGKVKFSFGFAIDGRQVKGILPEAVN